MSYSCLVLLLLCSRGHAQQANPPSWPSSVRVFSPGDSDITQVVNAAYANNKDSEFGGSRYAFLFKPGTYAADVPVGYYTQVLGLGESPDDVIFNGPKGVHAEERFYTQSPGALTTFWRSAENFRSNSNYQWWQDGSGNHNGMLWAVSQAAPLRRVHAANLLLAQKFGNNPIGWASGGYMGNMQIDGTVDFGSQQQWMTRNSKIGGVASGGWNMVFTGTQGAPPRHCGSAPGVPGFVVEAASPVVAEKPYITINAQGQYYLNVPAMRYNAVGTEWRNTGRRIAFQQVYVADSARDTAQSINAQLAAGMHVVFSPGIFRLDAPLRVLRADQVLLGLGIATLLSTNGNAVIQVGAVHGVRVAGLLLDAGAQRTDVLLQWGTQPGFAGSASNPGVLSDVFVRVGGAQPTAYLNTMVRITSGNVIIDNAWLWSADHGKPGVVPPGGHECDHGLVVEGNNVTAYGLAVEHTLKDLVIWKGNFGSVFFYQSELPYDVDQTFGDAGYAGYRVAPGVTFHLGKGIGVYHYFRKYPVVVESGIVAPEVPGVSFDSPFSINLPSGGIMRHVLNGKGSETRLGAMTSYLCDAGAGLVWSSTSDGIWAFGCDFNGADLKSVKGAGDQCSAQCRATAGCTHYTWTNFQGGTCWMKKGAAFKQDAVVSGNNVMVCGIMPSITWNGNSANGCDFKGGDFKNTVTVSSACSTTCKSTSGCTHYTWTSYNGGTCWMKQGIQTKEKAFSTYDKTMLCGLK